MFIIDEIAVDDSVTETKFSCDLNVCKGACCTFPGGRGAPLLDDEVRAIEDVFPVIKEFLPQEHRKTIERYGLVDGTQGNFATQCVDGKACVFVYYDGDIAKCSFERGYYEKKTTWQKPISCHLFPLRIRNDGKEIHYEYFSECEPALEKGKIENISVHRFVSTPIQRALGETWYRHLDETILKKH